MFLKALTLKGFKSFADATTLVFEPGVTVIVGPNGSGKSNVVDAVAWALGAQAPTSVRSAKMDDVIFAGTAARAALGRAEVSLSIDNTYRLLPIEFEEVTITRTLFRSGDSAYSINGVPCRLLDIQELLSDSGVGRQQHVIISQRQIEGVLSARPEDRRAVIEEAAGVLKYRRRKEKSERRLAGTEANLNRLSDVMREIRRQLKPLEQQATAARRHGDLVAELSGLRRHLAGQEIAQLRQRFRQLTQDQAADRQQTQKLTTQVKVLDRDLAAAEAQLTAADRPDMGGALLRFEAAAERLRGLGARLSERRMRLERELRAGVDEDVVATLEAESGRLERELAETEDSAAQLDLGWATATEAETVQQARQNEHEQAERATADARAECERQRAALAQAVGNRQAWEARREALAQALDENRDASGAQCLAGIDGVLGTLLDLVDIDRGWEAAFEAAAADAVAAVVATDTGVAMRAIAALEADNATGAVLALGPMVGTAVPAAGPKAGPIVDTAVAGAALRSHVRSSVPGVDQLLDALVGQVGVVDTSEEAAAAAVSDPAAVVVTRRGDRFSPQGWRVGVRRSGATRGLLEEAEQASARAAEAADAAEQRVADAEQRLAETERRQAEAQAAAARQTEKLSSLRSDHQVKSASIDERRRLLTAQRDQIEGRLSQMAQARAEAASRRESVELRLLVVDELAGLVARRAQEAGRQLEELRRRRTDESEAARAAASQLEDLRRRRSDAEARLGQCRERDRAAEIELTEAGMRLEAAVERCRRELDCEPAEAEAAQCPELEPGVSPPDRIRVLEQELRIMGPVNPLALEEYEALLERFEFTQGQIDDIRQSRRELRKVVRKIDEEIVSVFSSAYADVARNFADLFQTLFPGGEGKLKLTQPDALLDTGVEIEARPSGKNIRRLSLLSGGERSLTALAFLFAVFRSRPSPFYVMDEVEAALDDVNLHRFLQLIDEFRADAQLLIVSHQKRTMDAADCLYGVSMKPGGSSKVLSEKVVVASEPKVLLD